jgi:hypothetical protein
MSAKHTPGPWHVNAPASVVSIDGLHVCDINGYGATDERKRADAALISAAPDLLAAAETALADIRQTANCDTGDAQTLATVAALEAAILKARGSR